MTAWHITFGTYGTRLHGDARPTVERAHNRPGEAFVAPDPKRQQEEQQRMAHPAVRLDLSQRTLIETVIPMICERGGWGYRIAAAPAEGDHIHVLLDADPSRHGKAIRRWLKQWLTEKLNGQWPRDGRWWAHGGSTKPVEAPDYLRNVTRYIARQRTLAITERELML